MREYNEIVKNLDTEFGMQVRMLVSEYGAGTVWIFDYRLLHGMALKHLNKLSSVDFLRAEFDVRKKTMKVLTLGSDKKRQQRLEAITQNDNFTRFLGKKGWKAISW